MITKERVIADQWLLEFAELGGQHQVWRDDAGRPTKIAFVRPPSASKREQRELLALHQKFQRSSAAVQRLIIADLDTAASPDPARRGPTGLLLPCTARVEQFDPNGKKLAHVGAELARLALSVRNREGEAPRAAVDIITEGTREFIEQALGSDATEDEIEDARRMIGDGFQQMACVLLAAEGERNSSTLN